MNITASVVLMREPWEEGKERKGRGGDRQGRREREGGGRRKGKDIMRKNWILFH